MSERTAQQPRPAGPPAGVDLGATRSEATMPAPEIRPVKEKAPKPKRQGTSDKTRLFVPGLGIGAYVLQSLSKGTWVNPSLVLPIATIIWAVYISVQKKFDHSTDRPIPRIGPQGLLYKALHACKITYVPRQGMKELIELEQARHFQLVESLPGDQGISYGVICPAGGGGKGTVATNAGIMSAVATSKPTIILDSRHKLGNIAMRFGLDRRPNDADSRLNVEGATTTIRQMLRLFKDNFFKTPIQLKVLLPAVRSVQQYGGNLFVLSSDATEKGKLLRDFDVELYRQWLRYIRGIFAVMIHEFDNEINRALDLMLLEEIDVPVFVVGEHKLTAIDELEQAIASYRTLQGDKIERHGILIVVASGKTEQREHYSSLFGIPRERIFFIPYNSYFMPEKIKRHRDPSNELLPVVDYAKMPDKAKLAFLQSLNQGLVTVTEERMRSLDAAVDDTSTMLASPMEQEVTEIAASE